MTHVMKMFDPGKYVSAVDLNGKEFTGTIERVVAGEVDDGKRKAKKPMLYMKGASKPLALNKTNAKILIKLYGSDVEKWAGQKCTLYPTTTMMGPDRVDCIRIKPQRPSGGADVAPATMNEREPGDDTEEEATNANA